MKRKEAPRTVDDDELDVLTKRYLHDPCACNRDSIVEGLTRPVLSIAKAFGRKSPNRSDDIVGEALLALTEAVERFPSVADDRDIRKYVYSCVRYHLLDSLNAFWIIAVPARTRRRLVDEGRGGELPKIDAMVVDPHKMNRIPMTEDRFHFLLECVRKVSSSPLRRDILRLKAEGYKGYEIAAIVGISPSKVGKVLHSISTEFQELLDE